MQNDKEEFKKNFVKRLIGFSVEILGFAQEIRKQPILWPIADQLVRSATSIGANVVEAKASSSKKEYINYFQIALKSANETKYWLIVLQESSSQLKERAMRIYQESDEISRIIGSSVLTLKGKKDAF
jgi:four helix bundle protein